MTTEPEAGLREDVARAIYEVEPHLNMGELVSWFGLAPGYRQRFLARADAVLAIIAPLQAELAEARAEIERWRIVQADMLHTIQRLEADNKRKNAALRTLTKWFENSGSSITARWSRIPDEERALIVKACRAALSDKPAPETHWTHGCYNQDACTHPDCSCAEEAEFERKRAAPETVGQFGHHPDPSTDFCCEVEKLEGWAHDVRAGLRSQWPYWACLSRLLKFVRSPEFAKLDDIAQRAKANVFALEGALTSAPETRAEPDVPEELRRLSEAATSGPWEVHDPGPNDLIQIIGQADGDADEHGRARFHSPPLIAKVDDNGNFEETAAFIVAAVNYVRSRIGGRYE